MKSPLLFITSLLLTLNATGANLPPHPLKDFQRVVIADDALSVQRAAAEELANYAGRIVGRKIEVVTAGKVAPDAKGLSFFVGDGAATRVLGKSPAPWKTEEHLIQTVPGGMLLAGDDGAGDAWSPLTHAGSMLAVYTLLDDHLGVRWFWPGEFGEHVPSSPGATVPPLDVSHRCLEPPASARGDRGGRAASARGGKESARG